MDRNLNCGIESIVDRIDGLYKNVEYSLSNLHVLALGLNQHAYILGNYPLQACQTRTMKKMGTPIFFDSL